MALEFNPDELDAWPPAGPAHDTWKKGWESVFRETQARLSQERPELARDIALLTEEYMILQFYLAPGATELTVMHGMRIPMEGQSVGVKLSRAASNEILNEVDPAWRIELAREMVWTHVIDLLDAGNEGEEWVQENGGEEEDEHEMPWKDSNGEGGIDYSLQLPELAGWSGDENYEENGLAGGEEEWEDNLLADGDVDDAQQLSEEELAELREEDNSAFAEAADQDPSLRKLYFALLKGKIDATLK